MARQINGDTLCMPKGLFGASGWKPLCDYFPDFKGGADCPLDVKPDATRATSNAMKSETAVMADILTEIRAIRVECAQAKWAVRALLLVVTFILLFGFRIVFR